MMATLFFICRMINDTLLYPKDYKYTGTSLKGIRPPLFRVDSVFYWNYRMMDIIFYYLLVDVYVFLQLRNT